MAEKKTSTPSDKKTKIEHENVSIEININDKSGISSKKSLVNDIDTEKIKEKTKEKASEIMDKMKDKEKEIDLLEVSGNVAKSVQKGSVVVFAFLWKIIRAVFTVFQRLSSVALDAWKFGLIVGIIGAGATFYMYKTSDPYYNSDGYGISRITNSQEIIQIINSISIPNDEMKFTVKNDLNLPPEIYNNIKSLRASWLIDQNNDGIADFVDYNNDYAFDKEEDSLAVRMKDRFNVRLEVWDQANTSDIQTALLYYLEQHPFIRSLNASRLSTIEGMVQVYGNQASILDSLQSHEYFIEQKTESALSGIKFGEFEIMGGDTDKDKRLYHQEIISLKEIALTNASTIEHKNAPILFIGNLNNTSSRANGLMSYAKRVAFMLIPLAFLLFVLFKRKDIENCFKIKEIFEDK